jgi:hypothetical protein
MRTLAVPSNLKIALPKHLFKPADRIVLLTEGSLLIIKKLEAPKLSSYAARAKDRPLSLREIDREVQAYRRSKRSS